MTINDLRDLDKEDVLSALGLTTKPSTSVRLLGALGIFGVGLLVGAGAALLWAPKSGAALRAELEERFRDLRPEDRSRPRQRLRVARRAPEPAPPLAEVGEASLRGPNGDRYRACHRVPERPTIPLGALADRERRSTSTPA